MIPPPQLFFISMILGMLVLWIYCLIDAIRGKFESDTMKLIWVILLVTVPVVGVILYLLMGRPRRTDGGLPDDL